MLAGSRDGVRQILVRALPRHHRRLQPPHHQAMAQDLLQAHISRRQAQALAQDLLQLQSSRHQAMTMAQALLQAHISLRQAQAMAQDLLQQQSSRHQAMTMAQASRRQAQALAQALIQPQSSRHQAQAMAQALLQLIQLHQHKAKKHALRSATEGMWLAQLVFSVWPANQICTGKDTPAGRHTVRSTLAGSRDGVRQILVRSLKVHQRMTPSASPADHVC